LGIELAGCFLRDGYAVVGLDIAPPDPSSLPQLGPESSPNPDAWRFVQCDVADPKSIEQALAKVKDLCPFDVVVNNAGSIYNSPLLTFQAGKLSMHDFEAWNKVLSNTLSSAFVVSAHCARQMVAAGRAGVIVNISSICAAGNAGQAAYSAAKAGVNAMTVALAKELGPLRIRVAAIAPGFLDTASTRRALSEQALEKIRKSIPLGKMGQPAHLYHAIKFVIENEYFHGKVLELDGGLTI
jgi:3-oxoacyl-[acyl-carrier protein] reductase